MSYVEERNKYWTIYPEHIDYRFSRRLGRKISLDYAVDDPSLEEIADACKSLKIPYVIESDKCHPGNWIERKGRIRVPKMTKISKRKFLKLLAYRIKQLREKQIRVRTETKKAESSVKKVLKKIKKRR